MIKHGYYPYLECSSHGDKRFSAFYAKVNGKSIEEQYQNAKVFPEGSVCHTGCSWRRKKGHAAANQQEISELYERLWRQYLEENPELLRPLFQATGLSDKFGQPGHECQATTLWKIRCEKLSLSLE